MHSRVRVLALGAAAFMTCAMTAGDAAAQMRKHSLGERSSASSRSSIRMPSSAMRSNGSRGMRSAPRMGTQRLSPGPSRGRAPSINRSFPGNRGPSSRGGDYGLNSRRGAGLPGLLNGLGQGGLLNQLYDYEDPYAEAQKEHADAIRDAAIINGVASILGVVIQGAMQAPPAGPQASGHYETQRIKVKEGYWHQYQVLVPEQYDPNSGQRILEHYETRQKWIPPVYEERQVAVPYGR